MPNEPERPMEKLLRACAKKRREQAPEAPGFAVHPATRRLLQGEVARRFAGRAQARSGGARRWAGVFWPRLVEACMLVALLAVVGSLLVPALRQPKADSRLARKDVSSHGFLGSTTQAPAVAPAPAPAPDASRLLAQNEPSAAPAAAAPQKQVPATLWQSNGGSADKDSSGAPGGAAPSGTPAAPAMTLAENSLKRQPVAPSAPPVASESPAMAANEFSSADREKELRESLSKGLVNRDQPLDSGIKAPAAGQGPRPADLLTAGSVLTNESAGLLAGDARRSETGTLTRNYADFAKKAEEAAVRQQFTQVSPGAKAKAAPQSKAGPSILVSFQVEQTGRELRVVDSDGSVYTGSVQLAQAPRSAHASGQLAQFGASASNAPSEMQSVLALSGAPASQVAQRFFRVAGTNRSLNQPVVFTGNLTSLTNPVAAGKLDRAPAAPARAGQPLPGALLNSRISGQAVIGQGQVVDVNAVPVP